MATKLFQACKKRKRRSPSIHNNQIVRRTCSFDRLNGTFRDNIRWFIQNGLDEEDHCVNGHQVYSTLLFGDQSDDYFPLYLVEEYVQNSKNSLCDVCRFVGWGNHFMAKRRYHFIIPKDLNKDLDDESLDCGDHLLHGIIHCNGFGHLLYLQGDDTTVVSLDHLMDLWDSLCDTLRTRKITVHDTLKYHNMNLRLIYGVMRRISWYGKWGYKFCGGSFGVTERKYERAIEILSSLDLDRISSDFDHLESGLAIQHIIRRYREKSYREKSKTQLLTISDLFEFLFDCINGETPIQKIAAMATATLKSKRLKTSSNGHTSQLPNHNSVGNDKLVATAAKSDCRWPAKRLEHAANVIADILQENELATERACMCRCDLRNAARQHIGDTGLIDYVLKTIGDKVVGNNIIRRVNNPATRTLEFSIEKVEVIVEQEEAEFFEPGLDAREDMLYLYNNVLFGYPKSHPVSLAARTIMNSKYFVKEWNISLPHSDEAVLAICHIMPSYSELKTVLTQPLPPGEVMLLPKNVKSTELKLQAQAALRDTYFLTENFVVKDVKYYAQSKEDEVLEFWVRGSGLNLRTLLRYEGNASDGGEVNCHCGAKDDDGERMVGCDMCNVWQHTSCNDIDDEEEVSPKFFLCRTCEKVKRNCQGK